MTIYRWETYTDFMRDASPPEEDLKFFSSLKWLQPYLDPSGPYKPIPFFSRLEKDSTLDRYFSKTIATPETIPHALALTPRGHEHWKRRFAEIAQPEGTPKPSADWDFILLVHLCPDLSGFTDTAHGGVLGTLFDEAMGCCTAAFRNAPGGHMTQLFTANLNVTYRAPVELPCVVALRIRLERRQGRKWYLKGDLIGSDGVVRTEADSLWINTKPKEML